MKSILLLLTLSFCLSTAYAQGSKDETVAYIIKELFASATPKTLSVKDADHSLYYIGYIGKEEYKWFVKNGTIFKHKIDFDHITSYQFKDDRSNTQVNENLRRLSLIIVTPKESIHIFFVNEAEPGLQKDLSAAFDKLIELNKKDGEDLVHRKR